jgi:phosphohistidine swiveling domain-containing protein
MWKEYYSRPFWLQDYERRIILPTFALRKGMVNEVIFVPEHGKMAAWYKEEEFGRLLNMLGKEVLDSRWMLADHLRQFQIARKKLFAAVRACERATQRRAPSQTLLSLHKRLMEAHHDFVLFIWQPWGITFFLEQWFVGRLKERYADEWEQMYEAVARPSKAIQTQRMIEAVWEWRLRGRNSKQMQKIVQKFGYLGGYSANAHLWTAEHIIEQAGEGDDAKRLREARSYRAKNRRAFQSLQRRLQQENTLLAKVAEVIHEYVWLRTERIDAYKKSMVCTAGFFRWMEKVVGWEDGWSVHATTCELYAALNGQAVVGSEELRARAEEGYVAHITQQQTRVITGVQERQQFLVEHLGVQDWSVTQEVRGQVACKGVVRGRARVLFHARESKHMQPGEILVANMTHPDYMPAIRKAAAIVTDEGGVVCHAAVISRELKIPCVIGTSHATKVFHDGDVVEVDAHNGVVRKIT